jgi:predicted hydrocarbon binding protein
MVEHRRVDNFLMRCWLKTIGNIVGENGLRSVLNYAHMEMYIDALPEDNGDQGIPLEDARVLFLSLYELFGREGTRTLSLQAGKEFARLGIKGRPHVSKALKMGAQFLPETLKMRLILQKMVEYYNKMFTCTLDIPVELHEYNSHFLLVYKEHFESENVVAQKPVCNIFLGTIQYVVEWITENPHKVEEIECRALGCPADIFKIEKGVTLPE